MKTLFVATILALAAVAPGLAAQTVSLHVRTAGDLADLCGANPREPAADAKINFCDGYSQGVVNLELQHSGDKKPFCFPSPPPSRNSTLGEFVNWVRAIPDRRGLPAAEGLFKFLGERFPCK